MSLIRVKSFHPHTEFAPSWNIPLWLTNWTDLVHVDAIQKWIIDNEQKILDDYEFANSGGTGLTEKHITTRFGRYNLLDNKDEPAFNELLTFIRYSYLEYVQNQQLELKDLQIVCWANILRQGEAMDVHAHGGTPDSYLSGNMHFDDYQTKTFYRSSFDPESKIGLPNKKGGCVIFPSYTQHYTEEHSESKPRVSVAFDLRLTGSFDKDFFNAIPFMNQDILKEIQEKAKKELDKNAESK
jgi:hypothetical protein|tara:strand:- start:73 stop:792 length:720 start_codon:yes stop_codon:yes gene_type:complete